MPITTFASFGIWSSDITFYYGTTYRLNNHFYNTFDISYERYRSSCLNASYKGFGIRLDTYNPNDFALSANYFRSFLRRPNLLLIPYLGISPVVFRVENKYGMNLKPEIGFRLNTGGLSRRAPVSLSLNVSYGYDIPVVNESAYKFGRHDFSAKLGLSINLVDVRNYFNRKKEEENTPVIDVAK